MGKKGLFRSMILVVLSLLLVAGCSNASSTDNQAQGDSGGGEGSSSNGEKVTITAMIRWVSLQELLKNKLIPEFEKQNPNINIKLQTGFNTSYTQSLQAAITGGNLPDIFASHPSLPVYQLYDLDVLHKLDDVIGDRKSDFEDGMWTHGSTMMDGHIYAFPVMSNRKDAYLMYYNKDVLKQAGLSEGDVPKSWSDLVKVSKQIEEKTDAYGIIAGMKEPWVVAGAITEMASAITPEVIPSEQLKPHTGKYVYETEGNIETIKFFKKLVDQKIIHPSSMTLTPPEAPALFAAGKAAFLIDGAWRASKLHQNGFDNFGVARVPTKNGKKQYLGYNGSVLKAGLLINKNTEHFDAVKKFLTYWMENGYSAMVKNAIQFSPIPEINNQSMPDNVRGKTLQLQDTEFVLTPGPVYKNKNAVKVQKEMSGKGPDKAIGDILVGYITGQVTDLKGALHQMSVKQNQALKNALKEVQGSGVEIDRSAWKFPDWKPFKPYEK